VTWIDSRAAEQAKTLNERTGIDDMATSKRVSAKILWFLEKRPKVVSKAKYLLDVAAYFYLKLTGTTAFDLTAAFATGLIFPISKEWNEYIVEMVGLDPALLPERILDSFEIVGHTSTDYAAEVGFAPERLCSRAAPTMRTVTWERDVSIPETRTSIWVRAAGCR